MKIRYLAAMATGLLAQAIGSGSVFANEGGMTTVAALGYQDRQLDFNQRYSGAAENQARFQVNLPMLNGALTIVDGPWFLTLKHERSMADISAGTNETDRSVFVESNLIALEGSGTDVQRSDTSLTIGYNFKENANLFVGYLDGETVLTPDPFCANPFSQPVGCSRTNRAFQQFYLGDNGNVEDQPEYQQVYSEAGMFFGLSYTTPINDVGSLTYSIAYASMDGEYRDNANNPGNDFDGTFVAFHYKGKTKGTSLALTWSGSLGGTSAYFFDVRQQKYEMNGQDATGLENFQEVSLNTIEEMLGLSMGLRFYF